MKIELREARAMALEVKNENESEDGIANPLQGGHWDKTLAFNGKVQNSFNPVDPAYEPVITTHFSGEGLSKVLQRPNDHYAILFDDEGIKLYRRLTCSDIGRKNTSGGLKIFRKNRQFWLLTRIGLSYEIEKQIEEIARKHVRERGLIKPRKKAMRLDEFIAEGGPVI